VSKLSESEQTSITVAQDGSIRFLICSSIFKSQSVKSD